MNDKPATPGTTTKADIDNGPWNPFATPPYAGWAPYCLMCSTMMRMEPTDYGWRCRACRNPIGKDGKHWHGAT